MLSLRMETILRLLLRINFPVFSRYEMVGTVLETNFKDERLLRLERQNSMENLGDSREIEFNVQTLSAIS
jgi:hypothetical protein